MTETTSFRFLPDQVQAHRGASAVAPENTVAAFRAAREQGARWVELDVALLGDGTPVVIHDATLDRSTSARGSLGDIVAADLEAIDAGAWFGQGFAGERLPTLAQTLEALGELGLNVNVEIKQHEHHRSLEQLTETVHAHLQARNPQTQVMISSFDPDCLVGMHRLDPSYELAMLWMEVPPDWRAALQRIPSRSVHLYYRSLSYRFLDETRAEDIKVRVWTCNDPSLLAPFWGEGLAGVITDDPSLFLR
jgi:glycerophosphoryl diester phosphodiesterase